MNTEQYNKAFLILKKGALLGLGGVGGTDDDEVAGVDESIVDHLAQVGGGGEFLPVAENREQPLGDRPVNRLAADHALGHAIALDTAMQPASPAFVTMRVADECLVFEG